MSVIKRQGVIVVLNLGIGWIFIYAGRTALYPILPILQEDYRLSATQIGMLLSIYWVFFVLAQFPAGALSDRFGPKWVLTACYLLASLALLAMGTVAHSFIAILATLIVYGIGTGAYFPTEYPIFVRTLSKETRGTARSLINAGMSVGLALGLVIVGPIYAITGDWRDSILLLAGPMVLLNFFHARLLPQIRPQKMNLAKLGIIIKNQNFLKLYAASFCSLYGFWVLVTWTPLFLQTERNVGLELAGWITALIAVAALPGGFIMGAISDRLGRRHVSLLAFPIAAASIWAIGYLSAPVAVVGALTVYGVFGKMAWQSVEHSWMGDYVALNNPELAGSFAGVWSIPVLFSSVLASFVTGWIKDATNSVSPAYGIAAGLVIVGWLILIMVEDTVVESRDDTLVSNVVE